METPVPIAFTDRELDVMSVLWDAGSATVAQVRERLSDDLAYTTVLTVLFVVVGEALERALHLAGRATRWAWVAALAGSSLVPAAAWLRPSAFGALPVPLAQPVVAGLQATAGPSDPEPAGSALLTPV